MKLTDQFFGIYNSVLSHFDAIRIGMTVTPSGYV